jgi:hypothetical protein
MIKSATPQSRPFIILPLVVGIIGGLTLISRSRPASSQPAAADDSPESCIARLLAAERAGDMPAYLACFSEPQRTDISASWRAQTGRQTAAELRDRSAGLVGHAVSDVKHAAPDLASLILERIEKDHTARQLVDLERSDGRWLITKLTTSDWQRPAIPYGTPVFTLQRGTSP